MLRPECRDVQILGPIQAIFPITPPGVAVFRKAVEYRLEVLGYFTAYHIEPTHRRGDISDLYSARAVLFASLACHTIPHSLVYGFFGSDVQRKLAQDPARAV